MGTDSLYSRVGEVARASIAWLAVGAVAVVVISAMALANLPADTWDGARWRS